MAANWRGGEEKGGGGGERGEILYRSGMFSCSLAPQTGAISPRWAVYDIAHDTVRAIKCAFSEHSLDGQFVLLHPVIFYSRRDTVCVFTGMDGNSLRWELWSRVRLVYRSLFFWSFIKDPARDVHLWFDGGLPLTAVCNSFLGRLIGEIDTLMC